MGKCRDEKRQILTKKKMAMKKRIIRRVEVSIHKQCGFECNVLMVLRVQRQCVTMNGDGMLKWNGILSHLDLLGF